MLDNLIKLKLHLDQVKKSLLLANDQYKLLDLNLAIPRENEIVLFLLKEINFLFSGVDNVYSNNKYLLEKTTSIDKLLDRKIIELDNSSENTITFSNRSELDWQYELDLASRFTKFTSHQYPTLQFGVNNGFLTRALVGAEPLYLIDIDQESIDKAIEPFNPIFQQRLCKYTLEQDQDFFNQINRLSFSKNTFGFVLCWNLICAFPFRSLVDFINYTINILKPGGTAVIQFYNCCKEENLEKVKQNQLYYQTPNLLMEHLESVGIKDYRHVEYNHSIDYIEFRKPGILSTVKLQSVIGEIYPRSH